MERTLFRQKMSQLHFTHFYFIYYNKFCKNIILHNVIQNSIQIKQVCRKRSRKDISPIIIIIKCNLTGTHIKQHTFSSWIDTILCACITWRHKNKIKVELDCRWIKSNNRISLQTKERKKVRCMQRTIILYTECMWARGQRIS